MSSLAALGLNERWLALFNQREAEGVQLGRVVGVHRGWREVFVDGQSQLIEVDQRRLGSVAIGDWVAVQTTGTLAVEAVLDRINNLERAVARSTKPQVVAANVDYVLIVCGADRPLNVRRIERAVAQTLEAKSNPVVVVNKADLLADADETVLSLQKELPLAEIVLVSSVGEHGIDQLRERLVGKTAVLIGESGAGKSTLLNSLAGADLAKAGEVREIDGKGRHTTTHRALHVLPTGGCLIDSPGVRSLSMWASVDAVDNSFADIAELAEGCRFSDCGHQTEPGCAINAAIGLGELDQDRVDSWKKLQGEIEETEVRKSAFEQRQKERKFGRVFNEVLKRKGKR